MIKLIIIDKQNNSSQSSHIIEWLITQNNHINKMKTELKKIKTNHLT